MLLALLDPWDVNLPLWLVAMMRLALAAAVGGAVGLEREVRGRQAGFRTYMLVCLGSALVMFVSIQFASYPWHGPGGVNINIDPARIAYGVMTGVGFLGAGTIIQDRGTIRGLTTAAGIWCVAAVGLAAGFGLYLLAVLAASLILLALWVFDYVDEMLPRLRHRTVTVRSKYRPNCVADAVAKFKCVGLRVQDVTFERTPDLVHVDIQLRIEFANTRQYFGLERQLEEDSELQLISARET